MGHERRYLVLGTHNRKKGLELAKLFEPHGLQVRTLADFPQALEVVEDGATFAENAHRKAIQQARHLDAWVLGEDSGLAVAALEGRPGVFSARFSGEGATDASNNQRLLQELREVPPQRREAYYVCHATLSDPTGQVRADVEATCQGRIAREPRGTAGFGYDPLFEIIEYQRTFGELGDAVKSLLSHRGRAIRVLLNQIDRLLATGAWPIP